MTAQSLKLAAVAALAALVATGCATTDLDPEPQIEVQTVLVPDPQPCPALAELGEEPIYADTDAAIRAAPNPAARAKLYVEGRAQRIKRLAEYYAAKVSCEF